jgi:hypothetical protein
MAVLTVARDCFRTRAALQIEVLALRDQLNVLRRSVKRPKLTAADRLLWARLSRYWSGWRPCVLIGDQSSFVLIGARVLPFFGQA